MTLAEWRKLAAPSIFSGVEPSISGGQPTRRLRSIASSPHGAKIPTARHQRLNSTLAFGGRNEVEGLST